MYNINLTKEECETLNDLIFWRENITEEDSSTPFVSLDVLKSINNKLKQDDMTSSVVATQAKMKDLEKPSGFMPEDELYALLWDNVFTGDKRNFNWKL